jgi:hypothetical protein
MIMEKIIDCVEFEDLSESSQYVAELIGIEVYRKLMREFYSQRIYIQDPRQIETTLKRYINQHCHNKSVMRIAKEIGRTENYVRKLIREN